MSPNGPHSRIPMKPVKNVVLIAHDSRKEDLLEWVKYNRGVLRQHRLFATGTTGGLVEREADLPVTRFKSGPLGGDQQVGARIAEGDLDVLVFFWDPLEPQPHDPDVKALLRLAVLYNIPTACNRATADFLVAAPPFHEPYERQVEDHAAVPRVGDGEHVVHDRDAGRVRERLRGGRAAGVGQVVGGAEGALSEDDRGRGAVHRRDLRRLLRAARPVELEPVQRARPEDVAGVQEPGQVDDAAGQQFAEFGPARPLPGRPRPFGLDDAGRNPFGDSGAQLPLTLGAEPRLEARDLVGGAVGTVRAQPRDHGAVRILRDEEHRGGPAVGDGLDVEGVLNSVVPVNN